MYSNIIKVFVILPLFIFIGNKYMGAEGIMYGVSSTFFLGLIILIVMSFKDFKNIIYQEGRTPIHKRRFSVLKKKH